MTMLHFTFGAIPYHDKTKGTHIIHCWIGQSEMTHTDDPGAERRAARDAKQILEDIIVRNINSDEERLLQDGDMPSSVTPVFTYAIGVTWDKDNRQPSYKRFDYATLSDKKMFAPVLAIGREMYDYTFGVLKKREDKSRAEAGLKKFVWDNVTIRHGREMFAEYCKSIVERHLAYTANKVRFECPHLRNGYCSPVHPQCRCFKNGRCEEIVVK